MTFCVASATGQQFERSRTTCKQTRSSSRMRGALAAGPVSVRREADAQADCAREKGLQMQAFPKAAEGIRTLDLLHGKQCQRCPGDRLHPCKSSTFRRCTSGPSARLSPANHGSLWTEMWTRAARARPEAAVVHEAISRSLTRGRRSSSTRATRASRSRLSPRSPRSCPATLAQTSAPIASAIRSAALLASSSRNRSSGRTTSRGTARCERNHGRRIPGRPT